MFLVFVAFFALVAICWCFVAFVGIYQCKLAFKEPSCVCCSLKTELVYIIDDLTQKLNQQRHQPLVCLQGSFCLMGEDVYVHVPVDSGLITVTQNRFGNDDIMFTDRESLVVCEGMPKRG